MTSEDAYRTLREQIRTRDLAPGRPLSERWIAVRLGIGLPSARDALCRLEQDGLVRRTATRDYLVAPLTPGTVDDFFLTWGLLGPEIVRLGIGAVRGAEADRLRLLVTELEALCVEDIVAPVLDARFTQAGKSLFDLFAAATANARLMEAYQGLAGEMERTWSLLLADTTGRQALRALHSDALSAFDRRDGDRGAAYVREFIGYSHDRVRRLVPQCPVVSLRSPLP